VNFMVAEIDDDLIMLSALQHWSYCPRQCALIHLEQAFDENVHTMRGNAVHKRVDDPGFETFEGVRSERALPVWSDQLGLIGKCDMVEFHPDGQIHPVEYKHGKKRNLPSFFTTSAGSCHHDNFAYAGKRSSCCHSFITGVWYFATACK